MGTPKKKRITISEGVEGAGILHTGREIKLRWKEKHFPRFSKKKRVCKFGGGKLRWSPCDGECWKWTL